MTPLEKKLSQDFSEHMPILTSRGSSALYLALTAIREERGPGEIIVPSTVCLSVPLMIRFAGLTPRFCDVEEDTFCLSTRTVIPCAGSATRGIVAVHLFGKSVPAEVFDWARANNIAVIEDVAQAAGGTYQGQLLGSRGDFSIFSFDDKKIIRGNGGALLVRDAKISEKLKQYEARLSSPLPRQAFQEMSVSFRDLSTGLQALWRQSQECSFPPTAIWEAYRPSFVSRLSDPDALSRQVFPSYMELEAQRELRWRNYEEYRKHLDVGARYVRFESEEICWRLPLILPSHARQLEAIETLRSRGVLVSNHYFSAAPFFGVDIPAAGKAISLCAVNLWVDEKAKDISSTCDTLNSI